MRGPLSPTTPVENVPFTIVDVETTGLKAASGDRVCEIALLRVRGDQEIARLESLVHPQRPMAPGAMAVNGITDVMLSGAPTFATLLPQIQPLLHDAVLVAHNAPFDVNFLRHEFQRADQTLPSLAVVDTLALAQAHYTFPHNSLEAIAKALGLSNASWHRAMADVLTTYQVLQRFIADLRQQGPVVLAHLMHPTDQRSIAELAVLTTTLQDALQTGKLLHLRYQGSNGAQTTRVVRPLELSYERGRGYLRAFCHLRQEERNFRFDRIVEIQMLTEKGAWRHAE
ncbi:3'-5' exonuclease DinG [Candidatus Entotheonellaceae bacterium PAL068K]